MRNKPDSLAWISKDPVFPSNIGTVVHVVRQFAGPEVQLLCLPSGFYWEVVSKTPVAARLFSNYGFEGVEQVTAFIARDDVLTPILPPDKLDETETTRELVNVDG